MRWGLVNAFALPGGRVVLTSGLIAGTDRSEAVAAVLAHEIGHVARRDPLARLLRDKLVDVAVAAVFGVSTGSTGTGTVAAFLLDGSYTREQETAADAVAIAILNDLDIAAGPGAGFFDALARKESGLEGVTLLRSHPLSEARAADLRRRGQGTGTGLTADEWRAVQGYLRLIARSRPRRLPATGGVREPGRGAPRSSRRRPWSGGWRARPRRRPGRPPGGPGQA